MSALWDPSIVEKARLKIYGESLHTINDRKRYVNNKSTDTGQDSTSTDDFLNFIVSHRASKKLLNHRQLQKGSARRKPVAF